MNKELKQEDKKIKLEMLAALESRFQNPRDAGLFLALILDLLGKLNNQEQEYTEIRTLEIVLNNFFRIKYDFIKDEVIESD